MSDKDKSTKKKTQKSRVANSKTTLLANNYFSLPSGRYDRGGSFAKPQKHNEAWAYVDGSGYFSDIYDYIVKLKPGSKIYIADWGMSIDFYLKKKVLGYRTEKQTAQAKVAGQNKTRIVEVKTAILDEKYKLINVFKTAALRDIQIRIMLWDCPTEIMGVHDLKNEIVLEAMLGNNKKYSGHIKVVRHRPSLAYTHHQKIIVFIEPDKNAVTAFLGGLDLHSARWDTPEHRLSDPTSRLFPGDEYANPLIEGTISRHAIARMPWHDVHMGIRGPAARDVERNFIERWNNHNSYLGVLNWRRGTLKKYFKEYLPDYDNKIKDYKYIKSSRTEKSLKLSNYKLKKTEGNKTVQILRTLCPMTGHTHGIEESIYDVWLKVIKNAKHYVYIETQYLLGSYSGNGPQNSNQYRYMGNKILETIVERIYLAYKNNQYGIKDNFRAYIVFPVTPDGHLNDGKTTENMYWQWRSIHRKPNYSDGLMDKGWGGMIGALEKAINKKFGKVKITGNDEDKNQKTSFVSGPGYEIISRYLQFFNLRTHDKIHGKLVTEQIYVHSKMIISDDRVAVIGTANVNDRGMIMRKNVGKGANAFSADSEIAAIVIDNDTENATINGKPSSVRRFARDLRIKLWSEHLGLKQDSIDDISDPVSDDTHIFITERAQTNTKAFEAAFPGIPSNNYPNFNAQLAALKTRKSDKKAEEKLSDVRGHLVEFPLRWLWTDDEKIQDRYYLDYWFALLKNQADEKSKNTPNKKIASLPKSPNHTPNA